MSDLIRFGVSMDGDLLEKFDRHIQTKKYTSRSKALIDLIRENLRESTVAPEREVVGALQFVFNHHRRELSSRLTHIQHHYHRLIVSSQHIHLNHDDCLEIVVLRGKHQHAKELADKIKATKGVKYATLNIVLVTDSN